MSAERLPLGKECTKCGEWKLLEEFRRATRNKSGKHSECKTCDRERSRQWAAINRERKREANRQWREKNIDRRLEYERQYREENRELIRERKRRYWEANREKLRREKRQRYKRNIEKEREQYRRWYHANLEQARGLCRDWRQANQEHVKEYNRRRYAENREDVIESVLRWARENPEKRREALRRRRARKLGAQGSHSVEEWIELCAQYSNICLCCGESEQLTADHVIPLSKGGSNDISNIQPLCQSCNSRKGVKATDYRPLFDEDIEELGETG